MLIRAGGGAPVRAPAVALSRTETLAAASERFGGAAADGRFIGSGHRLPVCAQRRHRRGVYKSVDACGQPQGDLCGPPLRAFTTGSGAGNLPHSCTSNCTPFPTGTTASCCSSTRWAPCKASPFARIQRYVKLIGQLAGRERMWRIPEFDSRSSRLRQVGQLVQTTWSLQLGMGADTLGRINPQAP